MANTQLSHAHPWTWIRTDYVVSKICVGDVVPSSCFMRWTSFSFLVSDEHDKQSNRFPMLEDLLERLKNYPGDHRWEQAQNGIGRPTSIVVSININAFSEAMCQFDKIATVVEEIEAHESSHVSNSAALEPEMVQAFSLDHTLSPTGFKRGLHSRWQTEVGTFTTPWSKTG